MDEHNQLITQNLYELPSCSICLNELTQNIASLGCGHAFHYLCINQHFQYKGTCPNCQKRSSPKEIRLVVFPVVHNTKTGNYLKALLENIDKSEGQQVNGLLGEIKRLSQKSQKLQYNLSEAEKQLKKKYQQSEKIKREIESKTVQVSALRKQNININKQLGEAIVQKNKLQIDLIQSRNYSNSLQTQKKQMEHYKQLQKRAQGNSQDLNKYKRQMQQKNTSFQVMAKQFFEQAQLKNITILKIQAKQKQYAQKYRLKELDLMRQKNNVTDLKKTTQQLEKQIQKLKGKYNRLKDLYRQNIEKVKSKSQQNVENDKQMQQNSLSLSIGFSNRMGFKGQPTISTQKNQKNGKNLSFKIIQKSRVPIQSKISFGNQALKKQIPQKKPVSQITLKNFMN